VDPTGGSTHHPQPEQLAVGKGECVLPAGSLEQVGQERCNELLMSSCVFDAASFPPVLCVRQQTMYRHLSGSRLGGTRMLC
jgi:hypothetical protein